MQSVRSTIRSITSHNGAHWTHERIAEDQHKIWVFPPELASPSAAVPAIIAALILAPVTFAMFSPIGITQHRLPFACSDVPSLSLWPRSLDAGVETAFPLLPANDRRAALQRKHFCPVSA